MTNNLTPAGHWHAELEFALKLADAADKISADRFAAADLAIDRKADHTFVTDADRAVERALRDLIGAQRPNDALLGEEYGERGDSARRWIIDPIDGTANFLRGVPIWATLIGLAVDDEIVVGVVSAPALHSRWWAARGEGAWALEGGAEPRKLQVSNVATLGEASISFQSLKQWDDAGALDQLIALSRKIWRDRAYGDMWSYMLLADGLIDAVSEFDVKPYDLAALVPIVEEAGGRFSGVDGRPGPWSGSSLATNGLLHEELLRELS